MEIVNMAGKPLRTILDITDRKYGRLTALSFSHVGSWRSHYWNFKCECGKEKKIMKKMVVQGRSKSCGCLHKEIVTTHGMYKTNFYKVWHDMKMRCDNTSNKFYPDYGGRSISYSLDWNNFENFKKDMYDSYLEHKELFGKDTSIDRIDVNGNYSKENCRWATSREQQRNRRDNQILNYKNKQSFLVDLAKEYDISSGTLHSRINNLGWSIEKALTQKVL